MTKLNRRAALTALAGAAAAVPAISLANPLSDPLAGLPGEIAAKTRHILSALPAAGGDAELFAAIAKYEALRAAKWAVLDRDDYDDREDDHGTASDAEDDAFSAIADFPATTLAGVLAKAIVLLEDFDEPGSDYFANITCYGEAVAESLIDDLQRPGITWTPHGYEMQGDLRAINEAADQWIEAAIQRGHDPVTVFEEDGSWGLYMSERHIDRSIPLEPYTPEGRLLQRIRQRLAARGRFVNINNAKGGAA